MLFCAIINFRSNFVDRIIHIFYYSEKIWTACFVSKNRLICECRVHQTIFFSFSSSFLIFKIFCRFPFDLLSLKKFFSFHRYYGNRSIFNCCAIIFFCKWKVSISSWLLLYFYYSIKSFLYYFTLHISYLKCLSLIW